MATSAMQDKIGFVKGLTLPAPPAKIAALRFAPPTPPQGGQDAGYVDAGSVISFVSGVNSQHRSDILNSTLLAQLASDHQFQRETDPVNWYSSYRNILGNIGWVIQDFTFNKYQAQGNDFTADQAILDILTAIATQNELLVIQKAISSLKALANSDGKLVLFNSKSVNAQQGNFQVSVASEVNGAVSMKIGCFYFDAQSNVTQILWFKFSSTSADFYKGSQSITLDDGIYAQVRAAVEQKLGSYSQSFVANLNI